MTTGRSLGPGGERLHQLRFVGLAPVNRVHGGQASRAIEGQDYGHESHNETNPEIVVFQGPLGGIDRRLWDFPEHREGVRRGK